MEDKLAADQASLSKGDRAIGDLKNQLEHVRKSAAAALKNSHIVDNQMEQLRNKRHGLFKSCMRDEVALPITGGEFPDGTRTDFLLPFYRSILRILSLFSISICLFILFHFAF